MITATASTTYKDSFATHVGFGCVALTSESTVGQAMRVLEAAYEAGIRHFDTAPGYGAGYSERLLGTFLKTRRETCTVTTKVGSGRPISALPAQMALPLNRLRRALGKRRPLSVRNPAPPLLTPRVISLTSVKASVEQSLRSLGTPRIDILLLHEALPSFLEEPARAYLWDLRQKGIVGKLGVAAHGSNYLSLSSASIEGWDVLQYEYGAEWPPHAALPSRFPGKQHILHSCLGSTVPDGLTPGARLAAVIEAVPKGMVLFSSRQPPHIRANINEGAIHWRRTMEPSHATH